MTSTSEAPGAPSSPEPRDPRGLAVPELSLVVLVGISGSGKSTFARERFAPFEAVSSDFCRGLVSGDVNDQSATAAAFEVLNVIVSKRLEAGRLTVVDATNVQSAARKSLVALARAHDVLPVAIVLDVPEKVAVERNRSRPDRDFGDHVVQRQRQALRSSLKTLSREGFRTVHVLRGSKRSPPPRSPASRCSTTCAPRRARSTRSATCTAAAPSSRPS
ncbi:AAA family ATPase [Oerskovia sp. M15]